MDAIVTKPFTAHLILEDAERRLEVGERLSDAELQHWGRSVDHLVHTGRIALVNEVVSADASIESLVAAVVDRADELGEATVAKLQTLVSEINPFAHASGEDLPTEEGLHGLQAVEAEGNAGASVATGEPGGDALSSAAPQPSAGDPSAEADTAEPAPGLEVAPVTVDGEETDLPTGDLRDDAQPREPGTESAGGSTPQNETASDAAPGTEDTPAT